MEEYFPEKENVEFHIPAIHNGNRNLTVEYSQHRSSSSGLALPLPTLDLSESENFSENRGESQLAGPLCTGGTTLENAPDAAVHHKSTRELWETSQEV